jgi:hypothetical protein
MAQLSPLGASGSIHANQNHIIIINHTIIMES